MRKLENRKYSINSLLQETNEVVKHYADGDGGVPRELLNMRMRLRKHLAKCEQELGHARRNVLYAEVLALFERIEMEDKNDM